MDSSIRSAIVVLLLLPNILYACKNKNVQNKCANKLMNTIEQIGRYSSMFFMIFHIGIAKFGFYSSAGFSFWLIAISVLLVLYWVFWGLYLKKPTLFFAMMLAVVPSGIFILSGFTLRHWLLVLAGVLFSVGHIYVAYQNNRE